MQAGIIDRPGLAQGAVVFALTFASLLVLALVLARLTWAWFAPNPESAAPASPGPGLGAGQASTMFGLAKRSGSVSVPTGVAVRLLGVVAATPGHRGYALVQLDGSQIVAVPEGADLAAGIRLAEVGVRQIILERGGIRESLDLPQPQPQPQATAPPSPPALQ